MDAARFDIGNEGKAWTVDEYRRKMENAPDGLELVDGKLYWTEEERLLMLAALLEQVGADRAVQLGNPEVWRMAVASLPDAPSHFPAPRTP